MGGGMAYTFLKAQGMEVGASLLEADKLDVARTILEAARAKGVTFLLPMDHVIAQKVAADAETRIADSTAIPAGWMGLDIGPKARAAFATAIRGAKTVVWNGPMGVFELAPFREGTFSVARAIAESGATSIVGGGDSVAAVTQAGLADRMSHISTGGGASLEFLEGIELPGVAALTDKMRWRTECSPRGVLMRTPVIAGNWKMYKTARQAAETIRSLADLVKGVQGVEVVICPPFTALAAAVEAAKGSPVAIGAQDCYWEKEGAFTGQVAVPMIADLGCSHCIVGHSERRQFFGETDATVDKKIEAVLANGLTCIACVGETLAEREAGQTFAVLERQVRNGLSRHLTSARLVIAYEPVWAIGTGKTATPVQAQEAHAFIRRVVAEAASPAAAQAVRILYGGSVKPDNIATLMAQPDVDGGLVGGASLDAASFAKIVRFRG